VAEQCQTCRLWRRLADSAGECHACPPQPVLYDPVRDTDPPPGGLRVAWPVTGPSEFCGEWCPLPVRPQSPDRPRKVVLCGSTRFGDAYRQAMREETLAGRIVLTVGLLGHAEGIDMSGPVKAMLDELHLRKIDDADEVLVLNVGRYVGDSTRREIAYAEGTGKPVRYLEPPEGGLNP
jgi:hypothetical protein